MLFYRLLVQFTATVLREHVLMTTLKQTVSSGGSELVLTTVHSTANFVQRGVIAPSRDKGGCLSPRTHPNQIFNAMVLRLRWSLQDLIVALVLNFLIESGQ